MASDATAVPLSQCFVQAAAENGHHAVIHYLCKQKIAFCYAEPLYSALRNGHAKCVEVLLTPLSWASERDSVIYCAACQGNLAMVKFLLGFKPQEVAAEPNQKNPIPANAWRAQPRGLLAAAAASGNLELVKWMQVNHPGQSATNAINSAAMNGHFHVVQWLQEDRTEAFTEAAMHAAAARGNLPMVKWVHSNGFTGYVPKAVDEAARRGYLDVVKWFYANRPERCTERGFGENIRNGPLRVAEWLHTNAFNHVPVNLDGTRDYIFYSRKFELLLFMDARCPQCFTPQFVKDTKKNLERYTLLEELRWLNARFPKV
ncbi:hypothetical protein PR001_g777 [Phytophthora rubi]|uniref:Uncharacterized protein n=1 Tax=Phytophthora rubi TaxID=129364 RepID=A0A6A3PEX2_9STRA|nr:hypothetical protein PR001_g777 [Phytophthora rubi]